MSISSWRAPHLCSSVLTMNYPLVFLLVGIILDFTLVGCHAKQEESTFLDAFSIISVLRYGKKGNLSADVTVEEVYDVYRGCGKVIVRELDGTRVELFVNLHNRLYLEAKYSSTGTLSGCSVSISERGSRPMNGYFGLFATFVDLEPLEKSALKPEVSGPTGRSTDYIIGPSMPLYLYRNELKSKWEMRANHPALVDSRRVGSSLHRMFVSPEPVEFLSSSRDGKRKLIKFKQAQYEIERAPLLSQLAAYMSLVDLESDIHFELDIISIRELEDGLEQNSMLMHDHFKLPSWFLCKRLSSIDVFPFKNPDSLQLHWANILGGRARFNVHLSPSPFERALTPIDLQVDLVEQLMRIENPRKSVNIVDMKREIIYHLPNEPAGYELQKSQSQAKNVTSKLARVQNGACSILDSNILNGIRYSWLSSALKPIYNQGKSPDVSETSVLAWQFLIGNSDSIMYLGRTRKVANGALPEIHGLSAHEFEIKYKTISDLPTLLLMFMPSTTSLSEFNPKDFHIIGHLWILASSSCADLHVGFMCLAPKVLAFQLSLIDQTGMTRSRQTIRFENFQWNLFINQAAELRQPGSTFDISRCPLASIQAAIEVEWKHQINLGHSDICTAKNLFDLDSHVKRSIDELLQRVDQDSPRDFLVAAMKKQPLLSMQRAKYEITLAKAPTDVIKFIPSGKSTRKSIQSRQIEYLPDIKTQFECISYASENYNVETVLFQEQTGECLLYEASLSSGWRAPDSSKDSIEYSKFERSILSGVLKPEEILHQFTTRDLIPMNQVLAEQQELPNFTEACIDSETLVRGVRLGPLRPHRSHLHDGLSSFVTYDKQQHLIGFRFSKPKGQEYSSSLTSSRQLFASGSRRSCRAKCDQIAHCASFVYCQYSDQRQELCQLADISLGDNIKASLPDGADTYQLVPDASCEIYSKDYLSFFDSDQTISDDLKLVIDEAVEIKQTSKQDCARLCLSQHEPNCLWMSYCTGSGQDIYTRCMTWPPAEPGIGSPSSTSQSSSSRGNPIELVESSGKSSKDESCIVYKRKAISLFTLSSRYLAQVNRWTGPGLVQLNLDFLDKSECAERCLNSADCSSFDSCLIRSSAEQLDSVHHECRLLSLSPFQDKEMLLDKIKSSEVKDGSPKSKCDHYERVATVSRHKLRPHSLNDRPIEEISYWARLLVAVAWGLSTGLVANYLYAMWLRDPRLFPRIRH